MQPEELLAIKMFWYKRTFIIIFRSICFDVSWTLVHLWGHWYPLLGILKWKKIWSISISLSKDRYQHESLKLACDGDMFCEKILKNLNWWIDCREKEICVWSGNFQIVHILLNLYIKFDVMLGHILKLSTETPLLSSSLYIKGFKFPGN